MKIGAIEVKQYYRAKALRITFPDKAEYKQMKAKYAPDSFSCDNRNCLLHLQESDEQADQLFNVLTELLQLVDDESRKLIFIAQEQLKAIMLPVKSYANVMAISTPVKPHDSVMVKDAKSTYIKSSFFRVEDTAKPKIIIRIYPDHVSVRYWTDNEHEVSKILACYDFDVSDERNKLSTYQFELHQIYKNKSTHQIDHLMQFLKANRFIYEASQVENQDDRRMGLAPCHGDEVVALFDGLPMSVDYVNSYISKIERQSYSPFYDASWADIASPEERMARLDKGYRKVLEEIEAKLNSLASRGANDLLDRLLKVICEKPFLSAFNVEAEENLHSLVHRFYANKSQSKNLGNSI